MEAELDTIALKTIVRAGDGRFHHPFSRDLKGSIHRGDQSLRNNEGNMQLWQTHDYQVGAQWPVHGLQQLSGMQDHKAASGRSGPDETRVGIKCDQCGAT
jgi:hypothetical protein